MQVCVYLVQSYVAAPAIEQVTEQCTYTYYVASAMRDDFLSCAAAGMSSCGADFSLALQREVARSSRLAAANRALVQTSSTAADTCVASLAAATSVLNSWVHGGPVTRPLLFRGSCSADQRRAVTSLVNPQDSYVAPSAASVSGEVQSYSAGTKDFLAQLSDEIQSMHDAYEGLLRSSALTAAAIGRDGLANASLSSQRTLNATMTSVSNSISRLLACVGGDPSYGQCASGSSLFDLYTRQKAFVDAQQKAVASNQLQISAAIAAYESQVATLVSTFSQFFQSIIGPNGLIGRFTSAMVQLGVTVDTCGLTSPSWCSLSPDSWNLPIPYLAYIPLSTIASPSALWNAFVTQQAPLLQRNLTAVKQQSLLQLQEENGAAAVRMQGMLNTSAASASGIRDSSQSLIAAQGRALDAFQRNITNSVNAIQAGPGTTSSVSLLTRRRKFNFVI